MHLVFKEVIGNKKSVMGGEKNLVFFKKKLEN